MIAAHKPSVLVVDDESSIVESLRILLKTEGFTPHAAVGGRAGLEQLGAVRPDIVISDVRMPGVDGLEAARRIVAAEPPTRVVVLTTFDEDEYVAAALRAGVSGFLLEVAPPEDLVTAVRTVAAGQGLLDRAVQRRDRRPAVPR